MISGYVKFPCNLPCLVRSIQNESSDRIEDENVNVDPCVRDQRNAEFTQPQIEESRIFPLHNRCCFCTDKFNSKITPTSTLSMVTTDIALQKIFVRLVAFNMINLASYILNLVISLHNYQIPWRKTLTFNIANVMSCSQGFFLALIFFILHGEIRRKYLIVLSSIPGDVSKCLILSFSKLTFHFETCRSMSTSRNPC